MKDFIIPDRDFGTPAAQIESHGHADHRRLRRDGAGRHLDHARGGRGWHRRSRSSAPPTGSRPSAPAGCAWSRSRAATARRPPAPRRSRRAHGAHPDRQAEGPAPRRDGALHLRPPARLPDLRGQWRLRVAGHGRRRRPARCALRGRSTTHVRAKQHHAARRIPQWHAEGRQQPLFHLSIRRNASSARAACGPARKCRAPSR